MSQLSTAPTGAVGTRGGLRPPSGGHAPQTWLQKYYPRYSKTVNHHPKHTAKLGRPTNAHTRDLKLRPSASYHFSVTVLAIPANIQLHGEQTDRDDSVSVFTYIIFIASLLT